jgi:O-antigen ligase
MTRPPLQKLLFGVLIVLAPVAVLAPKGTVLLLAVGVLAIVFSQPLVRTFEAFRPPGIAWLVIALILWSLIGMAWALSPSSSVNLWLRVSAIMLAGVLWLDSIDRMSAGAAASLRLAIAWFGVLLAALLAVELVSDLLLTRLVRLGEVGPAFQENLLARGAALLAIFAWPVTLVLWRRAGGTVGLAYLVAAFTLLLILPMFAAVIALAAGSVVFLVARRWPRPTIGLTKWAVLVAIAVVPLAFAITDAGQVLWESFPETPSSWRHRLAVWHFVAERVAEKPVLGWGLDASRNLPNADSPVYLERGLMPLHPHSAIFQVWVELGLPGAFLAGALIVLVLRGIEGVVDDPRAAATRLATFTTFLVLAVLSFGMWQNWWLATAWLAAYVTALAARPTSRTTKVGS